LNEAISLKYFEEQSFSQEQVLSWAFQLLHGIKHLHDQLNLIHFGIESKYITLIFKRRNCVKNLKNMSFKKHIYFTQ
jgi:serine/threonine protein kinase